MIFCGAPERIEAPHDWENSDIQIEFDIRSFRVADRRANVLISECSVELKEFKLMEWEKASNPGSTRTANDTSA